MDGYPKNDARSKPPVFPFKHGCRLQKKGCDGILKLVVSKICHFYLNIR